MTQLIPVPYKQVEHIAPRVTALVHSVFDHEQLDRWKDKRLLEAGRKHPFSNPVTNAQLEAILEQREEDTRLARDLGTLTHALLANKVRKAPADPQALHDMPIRPPTLHELPSQPLPMWPGAGDPTKPAAIRWLAESYQRFVSQVGHKWRIVFAETSLAVQVPPYCYVRGTPDAVVIDHHGQLAVVDWKTSRQPYPAYALQTRVYGEMLRAHGWDIATCYVVRLDKSSPGAYQLGTAGMAPAVEGPSRLTRLAAAYALRMEDPWDTLL